MGNACEQSSGHNAARWYLLRHAQPVLEPGICYGQLDVPANEAATAHAAAAFAAHWRAVYAPCVNGGVHGNAHGNTPGGTVDGANQVQFTVSPLLRCQQLAQACLQAMPCEQSGDARIAQQALPPSGMPMPGTASIHMQTESALAEIHFGDWEGVAWHAIALAAWNDWQADFAHYRPGGGESVAQLLQRVQVAACRTAQWLQQHPRGVAVWVTHAGVMRALHWLQQNGKALPASAGQWPQQGACAYGQWMTLGAATVDALTRLA